MPIQVACPSCGKSYNLDESLRGKLLRCKACQGTLQVPAAASAPVPQAKLPVKPSEAIAARKSPPPPPSRVRVEEEDDDEEDRPRRKKKKKKEGSFALPLMLGLGGGLVLAVGVAVAIIFAMGGGNDQQVAKVPEPGGPIPPPQPKPNDPGKPQVKPQVNPQPKPPPAKPAQPVNNNKPIPPAAPQPFVLPPGGPVWKVDIGKAPEFKLEPVKIALPNKIDFFEGVQSLAVSPFSQKAALGYKVTFGGKNEARLVAVDLAKQQLIGQVKPPGFLLPVAVSDDGARMLVRRDESGQGNQDRLELWSMGVTPAKEQEFFPYGDQKGKDRDVRWAAFLPGGKLVTMSEGGKVLVFDSPGGNVVHSLTNDSGGLPALSPDRKKLAFSAGKELGIYDLEAGTVLGKQAHPAFIPWPVLAFSPSGKWFACSTINRFFVFDTATGVLHREIASHINPMGKFAWTSDQHILIGGSALFDIDLQIRVWEYKGQDIAQPFGAMTAMVTHGGDRRLQSLLVAAALPEPAAIQTVQKAAADPTHVVLRPGTPVKLDVSTLPDAAAAANTEAALAKQLAKMGCPIDPNAAVELVAYGDVGVERELTYYTAPANDKFKAPFFGPKFGKGGGGPPPGAVLKNAKIVEHYAKLKFVFQGEILWEKSGLNIPNDVRLEEGETMQEHLRKLEHPDYKFYQTVDLPRQLMRTPGTTSIGTTEVTLNGLR